MHVGYGLLDSTRGVEHRIDYDNLISNERTINDVIILLKNTKHWIKISQFFSTDSSFQPF